MYLHFFKQFARFVDTFFQTVRKIYIYIFSNSLNKWWGLSPPGKPKPQTKNPIIANFFRNICRADELGSGVRNLYRDVKLYSSAEPILDEGDIFTLTIPLNDDVPAAGQRATLAPPPFRRRTTLATASRRLSPVDIRRRNGSPLSRQCIAIVDAGDMASYNILQSVVANRGVANRGPRPYPRRLASRRRPLPPFRRRLASRRRPLPRFVGTLADERRGHSPAMSGLVTNHCRPITPTTVREARTERKRHALPRFVGASPTQWLAPGSPMYCNS